jgi:hypothetical protein
MGGTRLTAHLQSVRASCGPFTDRKSNLQAVIMAYKRVRGTV